MTTSSQAAAVQGMIWRSEADSETPSTPISTSFFIPATAFSPKGRTSWRPGFLREGEISRLRAHEMCPTAVYPRPNRERLGGAPAGGAGILRSLVQSGGAGDLGGQPARRPKGIC